LSLNNNSYTTGTIIRVGKVDEVSPPMTVTANPFEIKVPDDVINESGMSAAPLIIQDNPFKQNLLFLLPHPIQTTLSTTNMQGVTP
jgi:hypothetical protein